MSLRLARRLPAAIPRARRSVARIPRRSPTPTQTRLQSTTPFSRPASPPANKKKGTWRGTFLRWGLAGYAVWWYNTSPIFADESEPQTIPPPSYFSETDLPTVSAIVAQKRASLKHHVDQQQQPSPTSPASKKARPSGGPTESPAVTDAEVAQAEAEAEGAVNPETGEINWDCPCLGGMADGPCGEEFKAAFSCFVHSTEEPKGMDCIERFQNMQTCFRKHPDVYGDELRDDDEYEARADSDVSGKEADEGREHERTSENKPQDKSQGKPTENNSQAKHDNPPRNEQLVAPVKGLEEADRRVDAREYTGPRGEAEEGRRVDATDAAKPEKAGKVGKA